MFIEEIMKRIFIANHFKFFATLVLVSFLSGTSSYAGFIEGIAKLFWGVDHSAFHPAAVKIEGSPNCEVALLPSLAIPSEEDEEPAPADLVVKLPYNYIVAASGETPGLSSNARSRTIPQGEANTELFNRASFKKNHKILQQFLPSLSREPFLKAAKGIYLIYTRDHLSILPEEIHTWENQLMIQNRPFRNQNGAVANFGPILTVHPYFLPKLWNLFGTRIESLVDQLKTQFHEIKSDENRMAFIRHSSILMSWCTVMNLLIHPAYDVNTRASLSLGLELLPRRINYQIGVNILPALDILSKELQSIEVPLILPNGETPRAFTPFSSLNPNALNLKEAISVFVLEDLRNFQLLRKNARFFVVADNSHVNFNLNGPFEILTPEQVQYNEYPNGEPMEIFSPLSTGENVVLNAPQRAEWMNFAKYLELQIMGFDSISDLEKVPLMKALADAIENKI